jgi:cytosine/uracil/thiamine/allantoin permease
LAIKALIPGVLAGLVLSFLPGFFEEPGIFKDLANFAWFIGAVVGGLAYRVLAGTEATAIPGVDALAGTQVVE